MGRFPRWRRALTVAAVTTTFVTATAIGPHAAAALPAGSPTSGAPSSPVGTPSRMPGTAPRTAQQDALPLGFRAGLAGLALFGLLVSFAAGARSTSPRHREAVDRFIE